MSWTAEKVDTLKRLWGKDANSAADIAVVIGGMTRQAVIGKAHRLGLATPPISHINDCRLKGRTPRRRNPFIPPRPDIIPEPTIVDDRLIPIAQRRTLMQLDAHTCRWPVGDPGTPGFFFCGATTAKVYCKAHQRRAWRS